MPNRTRLFSQFLFALLLCGLLGCESGDSSSDSPSTPNSSNPPSSATPTPTPSSNPTPTPTPTPVPTPVPWTASAGSLSSGTWHNASTDPDPTHAGAYGGVSYAPNGDLYLFYDTGTFPGDTMYGKVRRDGGSAWSSASSIGTRLHSAKVYFDGTGKPSLATENAGNVNIYSSSNFSAATPTWDLDRYYPVNESNTSGLYPFGNAFIVSDGTNLSLYYTYLYYNAVTGASLWGLQSMLQTNGVWPSSGLSGTSVDGPNQRPYSVWPHGASGAYADNSGNVLALSHMAFRSTDHGASFARVMNTGDDTTGLGGVSGSCQNPADNSVILGNFSQASMASPWSFSIWGTRDLGGTFSQLTTLSNVGTAYRSAIACVQNLIVAAYTIDGGAGESKLYTIVSSDGGTTWSAPSLLVDATSGGTNPSYTFADMSLTANATSGSIALMYSLVDNLTPHGVYIKEFY